MCVIFAFIWATVTSDSQYASKDGTLGSKTFCIKHKRSITCKTRWLSNCLICKLNVYPQYILEEGPSGI